MEMDIHNPVDSDINGMTVKQGLKISKQHSKQVVKLLLLFQKFHMYCQAKQFLPNQWDVWNNEKYRRLADSKEVGQ